MRLNKHLLLILTTVFSWSLLLFSCGDKDKEEPDNIEVTPTSVTLESSINSAVPLSITCNGEWYVASKPDWINVSSTSGTGNSSITLTTLSDNESTSSRSGDLELKCGSASAKIQITQSGRELETLEINPTSVSLVSSANSSASVSIICNNVWTISSKPDWINVSSTSGKGNVSLTITALSANDSASPRTENLEVISGSAKATLQITQVASLESGCEVEVVDEVVLTTSATFRLKFGAKASYFYGGYLPASSAGWPDSRVIEVLVAGDEAMNVEDDLDITAPDLTESTSYFMCIVAYNEKGKRGEVLRRTFTTPKSKDAPKAYISDVSYDDRKWYWSTTIGATAQEYYMLTYSGESAFILDQFLQPSQIAMIFKDNINNLTSYVNSQNWSLQRGADEMDLLICTWAQRDKKWSSVLNMFYGNIPADGTKIISNITAKESSRDKCTVSYPADREKLYKQIRIHQIN